MSPQSPAKKKRPRQSGNLIQDNRCKQLAMTDIVKWCVEQPERVLAAQSPLQTGAVQSCDLKFVVPDEQDAKPFDKTLHRRPKYWSMMFVRKNFPAQITMDLSMRVDQAQKGDINNIFELLTTSTQRTKWPH